MADFEDLNPTNERTFGPPMIIGKDVEKSFRIPHNNVDSLKEKITHPSVLFNATHSEYHALRGVDIEVREGEFLGIVGRNGSGKSTLLKLMAGIYKPTSGQVKTRGKIVPFIELGVGFNNELSGRDNVFLNGAMLGFKRAEIEAFYDDIVEFSELEEFMDQKLKNYSSGMRVRLAFSIAIKAEADTLLIDEVLAVGDASFKRKCFDYFKQLKLQQSTVVFVTHDMSAVKEYCDRAIVIEDGKVLFNGDPFEAADHYLDLFEDNKKEKEKTKGQHKRIGTHEMKFTKVEIDASRDLDEPIRVRVRMKCYKDTHAPIFGIALKDATGRYLFGTNTRIMNMKSRDYKKGESLEFAWVIPQILGDGDYTIDLAISSNDGTEQIERWNNASTFRVYRRDKTPYPVNPVLKLEEHKK